MELTPEDAGGGWWAVVAGGGGGAAYVCDAALVCGADVLLGGGLGFEDGGRRL